jgi:hypothetical protein
MSKRHQSAANAALERARGAQRALFSLEARDREDVEWKRGSIFPGMTREGKSIKMWIDAKGYCREQKTGRFVKNPNRTISRSL